MSATIRISAGQLSDSLALRAASALESCTEVDGDEEGVFIARRWPSLSTGEELLWQVLAWFNGVGEVPSEADLRAGLDAENFAIAMRAYAAGTDGAR